MPRTIVVLPTPGPAGDHRDLGRERGRDRLGLLPRQRDPGLAARTRRAPSPRRSPTLGAAAASSRRSPAASARLGPVQARPRRRRARVASSTTVASIATSPLRASRSIAASTSSSGRSSSAAASADQPRARHEDVAVARLLLQHVADAGLGARRRVARDAQRAPPACPPTETRCPTRRTRGGTGSRARARWPPRRNVCRCAPRTRARRRSPAGRPSPCGPHAARSTPSGWRGRATARCRGPR